MSAFIQPSRLAALKQLQCSIFQTSYNPNSLRTGAKYLRARLRGPSMMAYYPQSFDIAQITRRYSELEMVNEDEEERFQDVLDRKRRGKGAPKKAKSAGLSNYNSEDRSSLIHLQRTAEDWGRSAKLSTFFLSNILFPARNIYIQCRYHWFLFCLDNSAYALLPETLN